MKRRRRDNAPPEWLDEANALRAQGYSFAQIAATVGDTRTRVYHWLAGRTKEPGRTCAREGCANTFHGPPRQRFCSQECWRQGEPQSAAVRQSKSEKMRGRRGPKNPNYRHGKRVGENIRHDRARFLAGDPRRTCASPDCPRTTDATNQHHVVYRQHVRDVGGDQWDPDNALRLCVRCHARHHRQMRPLALSALRDENITFAVGLLGAARAYEYLRRRYAGKDARLDALLGAAHA